MAPGIDPSPEQATIEGMAAAGGNTYQQRVRDARWTAHTHCWVLQYTLA